MKHHWLANDGPDVTFRQMLEGSDALMMSCCVDDVMLRFQEVVESPQNRTSNRRLCRINKNIKLLLEETVC